MVSTTLLTLSAVPSFLHPMWEIVVIFTACHELIVTSTIGKVRMSSFPVPKVVHDIPWSLYLRVIGLDLISIGVAALSDREPYIMGCLST